MRARSLRRFAPSFVVTIAACSSGAGGQAKKPPPEDREQTWTEFRDGQCEVIPDCSAPPGSNIMPCNPPPPRQYVECPPEILPTQPPDTTLTRNDDGTCMVQCEATTCDAPGPLRVRCPDEGAPAPTYEANLVIPAETELREKDYRVRRNPDTTCDLIYDDGRSHTNIMCPPTIALRAAAGVVPVISSARTSQCFYGKYVVTCPKKFHTWH
jgi:hypothetical protein